MLEERVIYDEEFRQVEETYQPKAESTEVLVRQYFKVLRSIMEEGTLEGETAATLQNFAELAQRLVQAQLEPILARHRQATQVFVGEIPARDDTAL